MAISPLMSQILNKSNPKIKIPENKKKKDEETNKKVSPPKTVKTTSSFVGPVAPNRGESKSEYHKRITPKPKPKPKTVFEQVVTNPKLKEQTIIPPKITSEFVGPPVPQPGETKEEYHKRITPKPSEPPSTPPGFVGPVAPLPGETKKEYTQRITPKRPSPVTPSGLPVPSTPDQYSALNKFIPGNVLLNIINKNKKDVTFLSDVIGKNINDYNLTDEEIRILNKARDAPKNLTDESKIKWARMKLGLPVSDTTLREKGTVYEYLDRPSGKWLSEEEYINKYNIKNISKFRKSTSDYRLKGIDSEIPSYKEVGITPTEYILYRPTGEWVQYKPSWKNKALDTRFFGDTVSVYPGESLPPSREPTFQGIIPPSPELATDTSKSIAPIFFSGTNKNIDPVYTIINKLSPDIKQKIAPKVTESQIDFVKEQVSNIVENTPVTLQGYDTTIQKLEFAKDMAIDPFSASIINKQINNLQSEKTSLANIYNKDYRTFIVGEKNGELIPSQNVKSLVREWETTTDPDNKSKLFGALLNIVQKTDSATDFLGKRSGLDIASLTSDPNVGQQLEQQLRNRLMDEKGITNLGITRDYWNTIAENRSLAQDNINILQSNIKTLQNSPKNSTWTIDGKEYSRDSAISYFNSILSENQKYLDDTQIGIGDKTFTPGKDSYASVKDYVGDEYKERLSKSLDASKPDKLSQDKWDKYKGQYLKGNLTYSEFSNKVLRESINDSIKEVPDVYKSSTTLQQYRDMVYDTVLRDMNEEEANEYIGNKLEQNLQNWISHPWTKDSKIESWANKNLKFHGEKWSPKNAEKRADYYEDIYWYARDVVAGKPHSAPSCKCFNYDGKGFTVAEAKTWLGKYKKHPDAKRVEIKEEYANKYEKDYQTFSEIKKDEPAMYWEIDRKDGKVKVSYDPKRYEKEDWQFLGTVKTPLDPFIKLIPIGGIPTGKLLEMTDINVAQASKTFLIGATQFPRTLYAGISAIPASLESGNYVKEFKNILEPQLYEAGYRLSKAVKKGHRTGDWSDYINEIGNSPAITDVVIPLAIGAGFSAVSPLISKAGGAVSGRIASGTGRVTSAIAKKAPTIAKAFSKAGITPTNVGAVATRTGRTLLNPYVLSTMYIAPEAANIGAQTALYHKGLISKQQWLASLQSGIRTGFQLGMFSLGAYKPSFSGGKIPRRISQKTPKIEVTSKEGVPFSLAQKYRISFRGKPYLKYGKSVPVDVIDERQLIKLTPEEVARRLKGYKPGYTYDVGKGGMQYGARPSTVPYRPSGLKTTKLRLTGKDYPALPPRSPLSDPNTIRVVTKEGVKYVKLKPEMFIDDISDKIITRFESGAYPQTILSRPRYSYFDIPSGPLDVGEPVTTMKLGKGYVSGKRVTITRKFIKTRQTKLYDFGEMYPKDYSVLLKKGKHAKKYLMPEEYARLYGPKVPTEYVGSYLRVERGAGYPRLLRGETTLERFGLHFPKKLTFKQIALDKFGAEIPSGYGTKKPYSSVKKKIQTRKRLAEGRKKAEMLREDWSETIKSDRYKKFLEEPIESQAFARPKQAERFSLAKRSKKDFVSAKMGKKEIKLEKRTRKVKLPIEKESEVIGQIEVIETPDGPVIISLEKRFKPINFKNLKPKNIDDYIAKVGKGEVTIVKKEAPMTKKEAIKKLSDIKRAKLQQAKRIAKQQYRIEGLKGKKKPGSIQRTLYGEEISKEVKIPRVWKKVDVVYPKLRTKQTKLDIKAKRKIKKSGKPKKRIRQVDLGYEYKKPEAPRRIRPEYVMPEEKGKYPGLGTKYPGSRGGGWAEASGQSSGEVFIEDEILHPYWKGQSPYYKAPIGPRFAKPPVNISSIDMSMIGATGLRMKKSPARFLSSDVSQQQFEVTGVKSEMDYARQPIEKPAVDLLPAIDIATKPMIDVASIRMQAQKQAQEQRQDLKLLYDFDYNFKRRLPSRRPPRSKHKFMEKLEDEEKLEEDEERKSMLPYSLGYKEKLHDVPNIWRQAVSKKSWSKKPKYFKIT